jgi:hypothetical protein
MFNVIRIPTKFSKTIKRFNEKDKSELLGMLIDIWEWKSINVPDTIVWDTVTLIYGEWMNMESKNWNKPEKSLLILEPSPSNPDTRVEYSIVEYSRVEENVKNIFYWIENNIKLSQEEYNKIKDRYWTNILLDYIDKLSLYILEPKNDKYDSHYRTIINWIKRDWVKEQVKPIDWKKIYS